MHFVIVGNGAAGIEAALTIRHRLAPEDATITVISKESDYFFSRTSLMYAYMDMLKRKDLEPYERSSYDAQHITLKRATVTDLDANARTITLDDGVQTIHYDKLLLATGATPRHVPFPGINNVTDGLVHFVSMQDLDDCERLTPSTTQAVVVGGGLIGIELAESLHHHGVHVTFLVREPYYWPAALVKEEGDMVSAHIRAHGIDLRLAEELAQIRTDSNGRVASILTNKNEEIPCQMLGICVGVVATTAWLKTVKTPPRIERSICIDASFATSLPNVFAAGDCVQIDTGGDRPTIETIWYSAKRHGRLAARSMMGEHVSYTPPLFFNSSKFFEIEYTTVGNVTRAPAGARAIHRTYPGKNISQRIVFDPQDHQRVLGFNMLGSRWNHSILERWILERRSIAHVRKHLEHAQFDVEFGRIPLHQLQEKEVEA